MGLVIPSPWGEKGSRCLWARTVPCSGRLQHTSQADPSAGRRRGRWERDLAGTPPPQPSLQPRTRALLPHTITHRSLQRQARGSEESTAMPPPARARQLGTCRESRGGRRAQPGPLPHGGLNRASAPRQGVGRGSMPTLRSSD